MFGSLGKKLKSLFQKKVDEQSVEELEQLFFQADLGSETAVTLTEKVRSLLRKNDQATTDELLSEIKKELLKGIIPFEPKASAKPQVIFIVGVNGNGKTTTVAKLAHLAKAHGKKVLIGACDTFRAAAVDQLEIWSQRIGIDLVKGKIGSDPAAVVFDALTAAKSREVDLVIIDTAGRLHTRSDLLGELEKMRRVAAKAIEGSPHETYLVLDATIGQNGIQQAETFHKHTPITGLILTKMDGSAKGGIALAIQKKLKLPIVYLGIGERVEDLTSFNAQEYVDALLE